MVCACLGVPGLNAQSFDCASAKSAAQKLICTDPRLSKLDAEMTARYKELEAANVLNRSAVAARHKMWVVAVRQAEESAAELEWSFGVRIAEITQALKCQTTDRATMKKARADACAAIDAADARVLTFGAGLYAAGEDGVAFPVLLKPTIAIYPRDAMNKHITGAVAIDVIIDAEGRITDTMIVRSLDKEFGLDQEALRVVRATTYAPCKFLGLPVACHAVLSTRFQLK